MVDRFGFVRHTLRNWDDSETGMDFASPVEIYIIKSLNIHQI